MLLDMFFHDDDDMFDRYDEPQNNGTYETSHDKKKKAEQYAKEAEKHLQENSTNRAIACGVLAIYYHMASDEF